MPIFTTSLENQTQSSASGVIGYPSIGSIKQFIQISDEFNREVVNPTNAIAMYTNTGVGTPTFTITNNNIYTISTTAVLNDDASSRVSGTAFPRIGLSVDSRSSLELDIIFTLSQTATTKAFFGLILQNTALTGLPTTARHLGCYYDTGVSNNIFLSSANGTTQVTTDVGVAATTNRYKLNIVWNGDDSAVISLYSVSGIGQSTTFPTLLSSQTVTSIAATANFFGGYTLHFYVQSLQALTAKSITLDEWRIKST